MERVVILQHRLLHYRLELFSMLREMLSAEGVELVLVHGQASETERLRNDTGTLPWAVCVRNIFWRIAGKDVLWQPFPKEAASADLVVMMQENRILSNYLIIAKRLAGGPTIAYWGHGRNLQSTAPSGLRERWKNFLLKRVDWWFAYTEGTESYLTAKGYPRDQITNLENAIDVSGFQQELKAVTDQDIVRARSELGILNTDRVGVFCGSLYSEKRIDVLLQSAEMIKARVPDFHLLVIGDGPSAHEIRAAAATRSWIHLLGVRKGREKSLFFRLAHVQLNPGAVGLHVLDAFSAGLPMVTLSSALHGPEVVYLEHEKNAEIVTTDSADAYSEAVIGLLVDEQKRSRMANQCLIDAQRYTVENMANNFLQGIQRCLEKYRSVGLAQEKSNG